jgi:threonylcarbamoyladenosine tRNA methylthiotransferase MtaB
MPVDVLTLGCRLNAAESESMQRLANAAGIKDALIINTCAVTGEAVSQARQSIRRAHRAEPDRAIIVTGCAVQTDPAKFAAMPEVARLIGNAEKLDPAAWQSGLGLAGETRAVISDVMAVTEHAGHMAEAYEGQTRAFLEVQNGCDHRCTFCIIPYGRGPARSVAMGAVVDAVKRLTDQGIMEVVLTGVDLTSYGPDLPGKPKLGQLVQSILRHVPALARLRLSSIDSVEADEALIDAMGSEQRLMPHLHLSLQSGSDLILKRMKRRHLAADAVTFTERLRAMRPEIVFGADFIAGFPTETDEQAEETLVHVEACGLTHLHVFPFSPRAGTPAAKMPQVPQAVIKARAERLRAKGTVRQIAHLSRQNGQVLPVLSERGGMGRSPDFTPVALPSQLPHGLILPVRIDGHDGRRLTGMPVDLAARMAAE